MVRRATFGGVRASSWSGEQLSCSMEQVYVRWSNFHVRRATFRSLEQLSRPSSKIPFAGANFMFIEQVYVRRNNFHVCRATFRSTEQLLRPSSKFVVRRATFLSLEQLSSCRLLLVALAYLILTIICFHKKKCYNNKINFIFSYNRKDMACKFLPVYRK